MDQNSSLNTNMDADDFNKLKHDLEWTRFTVQRIVIPLVVIFGIFGNLMSIAVLTRRWMRSSTNYYLTALAIYDTLYLIFAATMTFKKYENTVEEQWYSRYQYPIGKPLADTFSNTGVWLTLTFTIERWLCVCHPMRGRLWCTPKRAKYVIIIVCLAAALITFPEFFEKRFQSTGNYSSTVTETNFAKTAAYKFGYIYTNQVLFTFMPLVLLLIFNSLLIRAVFRAAKRRTSMVHYHGRANKCNSSASAGGRSNNNNNSSVKQEKNQRDQQKVTITLISVVVVFVLCHAPQAILNMYYSYIYNGGLTERTSDILLIIGNIFNVLVMVNAAINFVLYSTFNTKFRRTFKRISIRTYRRLQGKASRPTDQVGSDSNSPYKDMVTANQSTKLTKIISRSTDENLHRHLVVKPDKNGGRNSQGNSPQPLKTVSLTQEQKQVLISPIKDIKNNKSEDDIKPCVANGHARLAEDDTADFV